MIAGAQKFKPGDTIRRIIEPEILAYVIYANRYHTQAVDLRDPSPTPRPFVILERSYNDWVLDRDMDCIRKSDEKLEWNYKPVK